MTNPTIPLDIPNARVPVVAVKSGVLEPPIVRFFTDMVRRMGGERSDFIRQARVTALQNQAMLRAVLRGVTSGYYHTPSEDQILSYTATSATTASIQVAQHTRSTAAATLQAGSVASVMRGTVNYVYYNDAGDAGGAVTYLATTDVSILTVAGRKTIWAIYVEEPPPTGGAPA